MDRKIIKPIVMSGLFALAFGAVGTAGTFALFTDKTETTVSVNAGKVAVSTELSNISAWELGNTPVLETSAGSGIYANTIGGKTTIVGNELTLEKWAPGDGMSFQITPTNGSTVKAKIRLKAIMTGDLAPALTLRFKNGLSETVMAARGAKSLATEWLDFEVEDDPAGYTVQIDFPNHGMEITAREEGEDNKYQNATANILIVYEAVQANANVSTALLDRINTKLATDEVLEGRNKTMYEAIGDVKEIDTSYSEATVAPYYWDSVADLFVEESSVRAGFEHTYFKSYTSIPTTAKYSIYAASGWSDANVTLNAIGFDAGDTTNVASISYANAGTARENIIRTNSLGTSLTINAPTDTIYHYDVVGNVDIIAAANASYHEFGTVPFVEIAKGRVVLEAGASVSRVHVSTKVTDVNDNGEKTKEANTFDQIIVALADNVVVPDFTRDEVALSSIGEEGKLVVEIEKENKQSDFVYLYQQGLVEQIRVTTGESTNSGEDVEATPIDNTAKTGNDTALEANTSSIAYDIANNLKSGSAATAEQIASGEVAVQDIEEAGLTEQAKETVKEKVVHEAIAKVCQHEHKVRKHNDYWVNENNELHYVSDYYCPDCKEDLHIKHDMAGMFSNTEHHIVPFVVNNLNAVSVLGEETVNAFMASIAELDFSDISLSNLNYYALFESGRALGIANNQDLYHVDMEQMIATPLTEEQAAVLHEEDPDALIGSSMQIQEFFSSYYADFYLQFDCAIPTSIVRLCGAFCGENPWGLAIQPSMFGVDEFSKDQKYYLMQTAGIGISYSGLLEGNVQFLCGLYFDQEAAINMAKPMVNNDENLAIDYLANFIRDAHVTLGLSILSNEHGNYFAGTADEILTYEMTVPLSTIVHFNAN